MQNLFYILKITPIKGKFQKKVIILSAISFLLLSGLSAQVDPTTKIDSTIKDTSQTSRIPSFIPEGATRLDSLPIDTSKNDTLSFEDAKKQRYIDSLKATSDLDAEVKYSASDSIVFMVQEKKLYLYENSVLDYTDINLKAKRLDISMDNQTLHAFGKEDTIKGTHEGRPEFTQAGETYGAKDIVYNFATRKGRIKNGKLIQGEGFVLAEVAKYHEDGSFHGKDGKYTTCNLDHPHYYIESRKLKMIPEKKQLISGPLNLVIGDFPIPIVIPFGFLPNMDEPEGSKNGIIFPTYGEADDRGFFLRNLGYYLGINDYLDLQVDGDIYTRGGWRVGIATKYNIKYRFTGNLRFQYGVQRFNEKTDADFRRTTAWSLSWSHNQPIDPTFKISASVNMSSSNSFQRTISQRQQDFFTNNLNSSVNISKNFNNLPFSINAGIRHQQDLNKETVSMQLPELAFNVQRQTPFKFIKDKRLTWLKTLGINYNMNLRNSLETVPDTLLGTLLLNWRDSVDYYDTQLQDTVRRVGSSFYRNGMQHRLSSGTTIKVAKGLINLTPSFSSTGYWYTTTTEKFFNFEEDRVEERQVRGFKQAYDYQTSVSASSNFYGIYQLTKTEREYAFRQRFSPSIGYNYRPDFSEDKFGYYRQVQTDSAATSFQTYSIFEDGIYRGPGKGESQSMSFSLSSVIEMKYRKKESFEDDFDEKEDKFTRTNLLDNISLSGSYNFAADSFQLSTINARVRTSLFEKKLSITTSARLDPYVFGFDDKDVPFELASPRRMNKFLINETGQLTRLTSAQVSLSTSLRSKQKTGNKTKSEDFDEEEFEHIQNTLYEYVDFDIPWTLRLNYNMSYSRPGLDPGRLTSTANISGTFGFSQNWQFQFQTGYDLVNRKANQTRLSVNRALHCWQMAFSWVPFGPLRSYNITINVRSSTLRDLKLSRNSFWQDQFRN